MALRPYIAIARMDHWFKNLLVITGTALAGYATATPVADFAVRFLVGIAAVCLAASANYVINEWLDLEFDRHHPLKQGRPSVLGQVTGTGVCIEYAVLASIALSLGWFVGVAFTATVAFFLLMGLIYNVPPVRSKDVAYLDVLSESLNNPIRLVLGWFIVTPLPLPPSTVVFAYWMGGAFVMAVKRYAEYRYLASPEIAGRYRKSFERYTEPSLLISAMFYAVCGSFFLGVFLVKYRVELVLTLPFIAVIFAWYLHLGMKPDSPAQRPEYLYREKKFVAYLVFVTLIFVSAFIIDVPALRWFLDRAIDMPS